MKTGLVLGVVLVGAAVGTRAEVGVGSAVAGANVAVGETRPVFAVGTALAVGGVAVDAAPQATIITTDKVRVMAKKYRDVGR